MNFLQIFALILFGIEAVGILTLLIMSEKLFRELEENEPKYYMKIGRPTALRVIPFPNSSDISRRLNLFILSLVFRGIPIDFPKEPVRRRLAILIRRVGIIVYSIFPVLAALWLYFAHLNIAP